MAVALSTVIPQIGSLVVDEVSFTVVAGLILSAAGEDHFVGASFLSQQEAHLSAPHLLQQSPPCVQQEPQSLVDFMVVAFSCANMDKVEVARASAINAGFNVFMVVVLSIVGMLFNLAEWRNGGMPDPSHSEYYYRFPAKSLLRVSRERLCKSLEICTKLIQSRN